MRALVFIEAEGLILPVIHGWLYRVDSHFDLTIVSSISEHLILNSSNSLSTSVSNML